MTENRPCPRRAAQVIVSGRRLTRGHGWIAVTQGKDPEEDSKMQRTLDTQYWRLCIWNGPLFVFVFVLFWGVMGGNLPPFQPDVPASAIAAFFRENSRVIIAGMSVSFIFAVSYAIWGLGMARVMEHMVGERSMLVELQKWGAGLTTVVFLVSLLFWMSGAFRPEALPDWTLQMLYDQAWLMVDLGYSVTSVQMICIGVASLKDKRSDPFVAKWLAWFSIWLAVMFVTLSLMPFFRSGPFARNGILNYWIEFGLLIVWMLAISVPMLKAVGRIEREHASG